MRKQDKAVIIVVIADLVSTLIKFLLGAVTGSLALLADAWHSLGDLATSVLVFTALQADKREMESTPAGESKPIFRKAGWELRVSMLIGGVLSVIAISIFAKVFTGANRPEINRPIIAAVIIGLLILISYLRFRFESSVGKETGSQALVADANHSRVDMLALILVLISMVAEALGWGLDRWVAGLIGLIIANIAFKILRRSAQLQFQASEEIEPTARSVEDQMVLVLYSGITKRKRRFDHFLKHRLGWDDPAHRTRLLMGTVVAGLSIGILVFLVTGFYIVTPSEVAIVEFFGKPMNLKAPTQPGLHYYWPPPIGRVKKVDMKTVRRVSVGYRSEERKDFILWTNVHYIKEFTLLTGDNTFLDAAVNIHYRVKDPAKYLFGSRDPESYLQTIIYRVLLQTVGNQVFFEILTKDRNMIESRITASTQRYIDSLDLGLEIINIYLRDLHPPMQVAPAFEDVVSAQEDRETYMEEAVGYKKELIPKAHGEAIELTESAKAYRVERITDASGKAAAFRALEYAFQKNRQINMQRLRFNTLENALSSAEIIVVSQKLAASPVDLFYGPATVMQNPTDTMASAAAGGALE